MTTQHSDSPTYRRETYFLARPYQHSTSSTSLQVQHILPATTDDASSIFSNRDNYNARQSFEPILDIKRNCPPIKKLLRKVRSFSGNNHRGTTSGSIVIPPPNARYSVTDFDKLRQTNENSTTSGSSGNNSNITRRNTVLERGATNSHQHLKTYSVFERDSPKLPLAQFSKNGITFSQRTTPLVVRHSRLDRQDSIDHNQSLFALHSNSIGSSGSKANPLIGQVSWNLVEDRAQEYKIIDSSTNIVIGRWKLIDRHTKLNSLSASSPAIIRESCASSLSVANWSMMTTVPNQSFYCGQAPHLTLSRNKRELMLDRTAVWCFVVKGTIVATLKGYELSLISHHAAAANSDEPETMTHKIIRDRLYLDEYVRALRQRLAASALREGNNLPNNASTTDVSQPLPLTEQQQQHESYLGRRSSVLSKKSFRRHTMPSIIADQLPSFSQDHTITAPKPPLPIFEESAMLDQYVSNFNRLKLSDGIMISALALMLNLDEKLSVFAQRKKMLEEAAAQEKQSQSQQKSSDRGLNETANESSDDQTDKPPSGFANRLKRSWKIPNFAKIHVF